MTDNDTTGHRQRLRERFLAGAEDARSDVALLELLLTFAIARKDVRPVAEALLQAFGSLSRVLSASSEELEAIPGVGLASVALLKMVDHIRSASEIRGRPADGARFGAGKAPAFAGTGVTQPWLFEDRAASDAEEAPDIGLGGPAEAVEAQTAQEPEDEALPADLPPEPEPEPHTPKPRPRRKLQVSRSRLLEFNRLSQVLSLLYQHRDEDKIIRALLVEQTGLPDSQVESLISVGAAMGLVVTGNQTLTPEGLLVAEHDVFLEQQGTLEWCHYRGAGTHRNLIWFEAFNHLLAQDSAMTSEAWQAYFEQSLKDEYAEETISRHVDQEIDFVLDAYLEGNFRRLELLERADDGRLYCRRYARFVPEVFGAMVYDFCAAEGRHLIQVGEMATAPGSPAVVFGLDPATFRLQIEALHDRGWVRYETTHNLDQIRLKPGYSAIGFLAAYYEGREPDAEAGLEAGREGQPHA